jgi:N-acetylglucosaminyldiphosphoundecaprenol N-acetyl-beta-D-mannosaminyltransferase
MATGAFVIERVPVSPHTSRIIETRPRVNLGGTLIDRVDRSGALAMLRSFAISGAAHQVVTVNLDFLNIASGDSDFQETLNQADLAVADGMPLVWLSRLKGQPLAERVAGVELVEDCCTLAVELDLGIFLLGAAPGIAEKAAARLEERHPGLCVVGTYSPPMGPRSADEDRRMLQAVRDAAPGFLFVALGAPRQDFWIREHRAELAVPVSIGVGCVLDLLAGSVTRAPTWMQRTGLEWAWRLAKEPRRLWRRYLLGDVPTLGKLALNALLSPDAEVIAANT